MHEGAAPRFRPDSSLLAVAHRARTRHACPRRPAGPAAHASGGVLVVGLFVPAHGRGCLLRRRHRQPRRRRPAARVIVRPVGHGGWHALLVEDSGDHAQVGGLAEGLTVRARLRREFEPARLGLARLSPADGDGLVRAEYPLTGVSRGRLARIDGVEPIDRQCHRRTDGVGITQPNGIFSASARLDVPAPVMRITRLRSAVNKDVYVAN